jgi:cytochrome d ubiquinol oxidase subunit II
MGLHDFWFIALAELFLGFFVLEGFDFGIGMLMKSFGRVAKGDREQHQRAVLNTIGPVWDGNEVWLITAGGAMSQRSPGCMPPCSRGCTCRCWRSCCR